MVPSLPLTPLNIDAHLDEIRRLVREHRALIVTAAPGAGKTTRVAPALAADGPVILLQPRRVAARAIAARIAAERGWTIGREVGWHVRSDLRASADTRLLVATEGILTARLLQDPLLTGFRTVILDEFHERSIHADLGLALVAQAWRARDDLSIVVMSATLDAARVSAYLNDCPVVDVPGRQFPLEITYRPGVTAEEAIADVWPRSEGALLCFLPGAPEIRRLADRLSGQPRLNGAAILPLHGSLDADEQDAAIRPTSHRRVVLATNLAETTLTVPDVACVVDTGLHKVARFDPDRAIDSLDTERASRDSVDQRAGRAGRTRDGLVVRLWDERDRLRPHREPEITRVDLTSPLLAVLAWGGNPRQFEWLDAPAPNAVDAALDVLHRLGAVDAAGALTPLGRTLQHLPIHPRLGRILLEGHGAPIVARACALLSERYFVPPRTAATTCDLLTAADVDESLPPHVRQVAREIREALRRSGVAPADRISDEEFRRAVLAGYPDRLARRRASAKGKTDRFVLASGTGARLARESGVHDAEFIVAVDVAGGHAGPSSEALIRLATAIDRDWIGPVSSSIRHELGEDGVVRAARIDRYDQLTLGEHPVAIDPVDAAALLAAAYLDRDPSSDDVELKRRALFAGLELDWPAMVRGAAQGQRRLSDVTPASHVPPAVRAALDRDAPSRWRLPSGRSTAFIYQDDGRVIARVKLQELFDVTETPRIGPRRVAVTVELLAPNGRPVQVTSDLSSFWKTAYPGLQPALRARYPRHKW